MKSLVSLLAALLIGSTLVSGCAFFEYLGSLPPPPPTEGRGGSGNGGGGGGGGY